MLPSLPAALPPLPLRRQTIYLVEMTFKLANSLSLWGTLPLPLSPTPSLSHSPSSITKSSSLETIEKHSMCHSNQSKRQAERERGETGRERERGRLLSESCAVWRWRPRRRRRHIYRSFHALIILISGSGFSLPQENERNHTLLLTLTAVTLPPLSHSLSLSHCPCKLILFLGFAFDMMQKINNSSKRETDRERESKGDSARCWGRHPRALCILIMVH